MTTSIDWDSPIVVRVKAEGGSVWAELVNVADDAILLTHRISDAELVRFVGEHLAAASAQPPTVRGAACL